MASERDSIEFHGITFIRYPNGKTKTSQRYYAPYIGNKRAPGVGLLHREIWTSIHGPIPPGYEIHHRDGNPLNNDPANLECLSGPEHAARHAAEFHDRRSEHVDTIRHLAAAWHSSDEGRAWHRDHGRETWTSRQPIDRICVECGNAYQSLARRDTDAYCSKLCQSRHGQRTRRDFEDRVCAICGAVFRIKQSKKQATCSRSCGAQLRKQNR